MHYGTSAKGKVPVLFVPSLINPPHVLDLSESGSLLRHFAARGHDVWMIDWGTPTAADAALDLAGHVAQRPTPLIQAIGRPPLLVGYCLGGTLAIGAASVNAVEGVVAMAAPWDFDGFPDDARATVSSLWSEAHMTCQKIGYVPMEVLQSGFWAMDPSRTIRKYAAFADMASGSDEERAFVLLEDWANAGPPLTFATGADLFDRLYETNDTGRGQWTIEGVAVRPEALSCPSLAIASLTDRIVPEASTPMLRERRTLGLGHVGMIVGRQARALLWDPLEEWITARGA